MANILQSYLIDDHFSQSGIFRIHYPRALKKQGIFLECHPTAGIVSMV